MGIGMIVVVDRAYATTVIDAAAEHGVEAWIIGSVEPGRGVSYDR
jgi:phosphoribosylaminoimidazole (AIR) synthetase